MLYPIRFLASICFSLASVSYSIKFGDTESRQGHQNWNRCMYRAWRICLRVMNSA